MPLQRLCTRPLVAAVLAALFGAAGIAAAQPQQLLGQIAIPDPSAAVEGSDNTAGVYVKDSAIALEKFALAQRMENLKAWGKSADLYQEILEKYPDRVVPAGVDADKRIVQYTSVTEAVREALCKWPPAGRDVYRSRYEAAAQSLLADAAPGDLSNLHKVFSLYFPTASAKTAGLRLMDYYFETGDYSAVEQIGRRLLDWHPDLIAERPGVLYRVAIADKLCGNGEEATHWLKELQSRYPKATGAVRGDDVVLADSLADELKTVTEIVRAATDDSWPTYGGNAGRDKSSSATAFAGAKLYSIPLSRGAGGEDSGSNLGVMPVAECGELFFQDNLRLYAINLDSGLPLAGWAATYPASDGQYVLPASGSRPLPAGNQFCITLTDKCVIAVMGLPDHMAQMTGAAQAGQSRLVCLDRATGRQLWNQSAKNLPEGAPASDNLEMGGAPLVVGDYVYVMAHGGKGGGSFQDCYVLCFGLANGDFKWASYLASSGIQNAQMWMMNQGPNMGLAEDTNSALAYASGRVFAVSNIGVVAALDAYSGSIIWLNIYRQAGDVPQFNRFGMMQLDPSQAIKPLRPWICNPAIVQNGKVFARPLDKDCLLVYDAGNGTEIKRIQLSDFESDNSTGSTDVSLGMPTMLLSVMGDSVIMAGNHGVWKIPWKAYDSDHNRSPDGFWRSAPIVAWTPDPAAPAKDEAINGRGFITADSVYVPTNFQLIPLSRRSGMVDSKKGFFPKGGWDPAEGGPGNVLVVQDEVVIAGDRRVDVYSDLKMATDKLDRGVADAPSDPQPRLRYAEVMFAAGRTDLAYEKLTQALQLLATPQGLQIGPDRARAFGDALSFAVKLADRKAPLDETNRMFDTAMLTAQTSSQQVACRIERAKFDLAGRNIAGAVDCYQQVLADEQMRLVPLPDQDNSQSSQAGIVAEKAIFNLLADPRGVAAYDKYEKQASARLAAATAASDPQQLLNVAQVYPNSQVARQAMLAAADVFESNSNFRMATQVLRRLLIKYSDSGRIPVLEAMARDYLKIPGRLDVAVARLAMAIRSAPNARLTKPLVLPDGTLLQDTTLKQAYDALVKYSASISTESLPDFNLPTKEEITAYSQAHQGKQAPWLPELLVANVGTLLKPQDGFARYDRLVTWNSGSGLAFYPVASAQPSASCASITDNPRSVAWLGEKALVWSEGSIDLVAGDTGKVLWKVAIASLPALNVAAAETPPPPQPVNVPNVRVRQMIVINGRVVGNAPAQPAVVAPPQPVGPEQIDQIRPVGDRIIVASNSGRILAIDAGNGQIAWQTRVSSHAVDHLCANDDFTVMRSVDAGSVSLIVLNTYSGEMVASKSFMLGAPLSEYPINLALGDDGNLVYTTPTQVCVKDLFDADLSEHGLDPRISSPPVPPNPVPLFQGCDGPDQLLISRGRIFALAELGREVHVYDLDTAQPARQFDADANGQVPIIWASGNTAGAANGVAMKTSGDYFFVRSSKGVCAYSLSQSYSWVGSAIENDVTTDWLFGKEALITVSHKGTPLAESNKVDPGLTLFNYSRRAVPSHPQKESGALDSVLSLFNPAGISGLQAVAGGIAYVTGDGVLHTLLGSHGHLPE